MQGGRFGPAAPVWTYVREPKGSFFSTGLSGAQRLADGNTLICSGEQGWFFEVTSAGGTVWEYRNLLPAPDRINVFRVERLTLRESELANGP
jgi:hypothetical protein